MRLFKVIGTRPSSLLCFSGGVQLSCGGQLACLRKLNREVCQSGSQFDGALDPRCSWFELSHTLMTLPEACNGCRQHSKHTDSVCASRKPFAFHYQKNMFIRRALQNIRCLSLTTFWQNLLFSPSTAPHWQVHVFFLVISFTTSYWKPESSHLYDCVYRMLLKWSQLKKRRKNCLAQPKALRHTAIHICNALLPCNINLDIGLVVTNSFPITTSFKVW